jgi:hypothetical protein
MGDPELLVKLPLDSPNWVLLIDAYRCRYQQVGLDRFALFDIQLAVEGAIEGRPTLRTKARQLADGQHSETELTKAFWQEFKLYRWDKGLRLISSTGKRVPVGTLVIYVWWPDFKIIFGGEVAPTPKIEGPPETSATTGTPTRRGRKSLPELDVIRAICDTYFYESGVPDNLTPLVNDLLEAWSKRYPEKKPPEFRTMHGHVSRWAAAFKETLPTK